MQIKELKIGDYFMMEGVGLFKILRIQPRRDLNHRVDCLRLFPSVMKMANFGNYEAIKINLCKICKDKISEKDPLDICKCFNLWNYKDDA